MKLKIGDKVRIKTWTDMVKSCDHYDSISKGIILSVEAPKTRRIYTKHMIELFDNIYGRLATIIEVIEDPYDQDEDSFFYKIVEDYGEYAWCNFAFNFPKNNKIGEGGITTRFEIMDL